MAGVALVAALALAGAQPQDCAPDPPLSYVCGMVKPEDVLAVPGTPWLIASGFAPGAGLKLIDSRTAEFQPFYRGEVGQIDLDKQAWPGCPGPVDAGLFNARGLGLRQTGRNRWQLLAVNHGGREAIEVFDVVAGGNTRPTLKWRGCATMPPGQVGNAVASFADGTVLVTVLTRPGTTIGDFVQGRITGGVWQMRPRERSFSLLPGTELPGNNGLEIDPDQRHFYVVAFGWHSVLVYDRRATAEPVARIQAPGFMPDNIHWTGGRLLLTGMRWNEPACGGLRRVVDGIADPMLCHRGWAVGELDRQARTIRIAAAGPPVAGFNGHSAAAIAGGRLWLGSFQASRLAWLPLPEQLQKGSSND